MRVTILWTNDVGRVDWFRAGSGAAIDYSDRLVTVTVVEE